MERRHSFGRSCRKEWEWEGLQKERVRERKRRRSPPTHTPLSLQVTVAFVASAAPRRVGCCRPAAAAAATAAKADRCSGRMIEVPTQSFISYLTRRWYNALRRIRRKIPRLICDILTAVRLSSHLIRIIFGEFFSSFGV